jgi:hypothetical protein
MMRRLLLALLLCTASASAFAQQPQYFPATGEMKVKLLPFGDVVDTFNDPAALDTSVNWNSATTTGSGLATYSQGQEVLSVGTTPGTALLTTKKKFPIKSPAYLLWRGAINANNGTVSGVIQPEPIGNCKQMGFFVAAGSPTCAAPVTDGILFEITSNTTPASSNPGNVPPGGGKLQAVTYAGGVRTLIADLSVDVGVRWAPIPASDGSILCPGRSTPQAFSDTCPHIMDIYFNGNSAEFDVDFKRVASMDVGSLGPNNNLLPASYQIINGTGPAASSIKINQAVSADDSRSTVAALGAANVTPVPCSGTITSGNTAQNAFAAQTVLHGFTIANIDTTEPLWLSFTGTAAASGTDSYPLAAATATTFAGFGSFTSPMGFGINHALSVVAATTSHKYSCTWW